MQQNTITLIVAGMGIAGTLGGTFIGTLFQGRAQHQQWKRDNVRQECRELLGQLSVNLFTFIDWHRTTQPGGARPDAAMIQKQYSDAVLDLHRNLGSRILIASALKEAKIQQRWDHALSAYYKDRDEKKLEIEYQNIADDIVKIGVSA